MAFCVCIVFSRIGERIDQTLTSVFEQDFSDLRLFLLDNACPGFDHAGLENLINQHKTGKNANIIISRNSRRANGSEVFKQCLEASEGCDFTILCPDEVFTSSTILTQATKQLQKNTLFYVKCGDDIIPFFSKDFNIPLKLDPYIISVRRALDKTRCKVFLINNIDWINHEILKLNYSRYIKLESIINGLINLNFINYNLYIFEREIQNEITDVLIRPKGCQWNIPESERAYMSFLQQLLEILFEADAKSRWKYSKLKKDMKALLERIKNISESKLKIVFFAQEYSVWPSLQSFYDACNKDERFIAQHVYIPFSHQNYKEGHAVPNEEMEPYWKERYPIMPYTMYDLSKESPDVAVFVKPYDLIPKQFYIYDIDKVVRRCVYIRYGFEIAAWNLDYHFKMPLQYLTWKFIVYGDMVKELAKKVRHNQEKNIVAWGHPRADYYSNLEEKRNTIPEEWKMKINGRKTILWNTQHTLKEGPGAGTFFIWKEEIFSYFENHPDIVLLWRPHPLMFGALVNSGLMTEFELNHLVEIVEKKDNVILDRSPDYRNSFYASDAIITDGTAFLIEYLYTGRPLIFTIKESGGGIYFYDEICSNVYVAREKGDIIKLLEDVRQDIDPMKEKRLSLAKRLLKVNPGGNGEYIKDQIFSELTKECSFEI